MNRFTKALKRLVPNKRRLIQLYCALLANANLKGFATGKIYTGIGKNVCTPGLNCYSCPGAVSSCPLGAMQNALASSGKTAPFYVFGIILLFGITLGRTVCGFLCPFGLIQDLIYKIKTPKIRKSKITKLLSSLKYVFLVLFCVIFPLMYAFKDYPLPAFCKYVCPAGTLEGALTLLSHSRNDGFFSVLGGIFTWKFILLISILTLCVFMYRSFCRFICPLGALYGLFNRFSVFGVKLARSRCIDCGRCISICKMDITEVGDKDCISCGDCLAVCPTEAISYRGGKILLPDNEIPKTADEAEQDKIKKKRRLRKVIVNTVSSIIAIALLVGTLIHCNVQSKKDEGGNEVGSIIYDYEFDLLVEEGTLKLSDIYKEKSVTVINFWGTWCAPCMDELPDFSRIAEEYSSDVTVLAVHTTLIGSVHPEEYIGNNFADSKMIFVWDKPGEGTDEYYTMLGGAGAYPLTFIINKDGRIISIHNKMSYDELSSAIENAKIK